jgi:hypothetical protein
MRKHPITHRVKSHNRDGKKVSTYVRGSRRLNPLRLANPTLTTPKGYTVKLRYSAEPHDLETIKVIATSYTRAIDEALEEKQDKRTPIEILVIDPSIGEIIHWAGHNTLELGKIAGKTALNTAKTGYRDLTDVALEHTAATNTGFTGALAKRQLEHRNTKKEEVLVRQAYGKDKAKSAIARAQLRKYHPEVWNVMDLSRS